ncbi:NADH-quinone oxidoreductase subunit F [candidate division KSB3 bacterium]|uniref:NADH-quinone oxidoreductase subunit F n=1 Tax=candidate division KSB3 bacterium TaxID=2044937 RepID=A0A2G6EAF0_9BACT|nr:MAG: NADH-quinone oxidoreductase subunit F [candidate division KSB3 bacterium]PIE30772.1 MAG: NADH-quinone oxidoreductase subunit F [candidate division KSB3 bacterium]
MEAIRSYDELVALYDRVKPVLDSRLHLKSAEEVNLIGAKKIHRKVLVCGGTGCQASESKSIVEEFKRVLEQKNLTDSVDISITGCFGFCERGPILKIFPDDVFYSQVTQDDVSEIVERHIQCGIDVGRLLYVEPTVKERVRTQQEMSFYKKQKRIALRNCGLINPEDINEYIANRGYQALGKVLREMTSAEVIELIKQSGLRGRGGGGFPTGLKWEFAAKNQSDEKFVLCNADEGDPGAFMDRSIMEGDSHSVLEAMAIAGYAIGAQHGYIYIRAEYPLAIKRLEIALQQAKELGVLGENIFGSGFSFDVSIKYGAGAFICGEETALIHSIEGERGEPTTKPPFPAQSGVWNKPTIVNNVETYANIPWIILKGPEWYGSIGTDDSKGTKVFALAGQINNVGLVEVPMGTTLREIIYEIGGGISGGHEFKAVQTGGPSGGCIPKENLDTPIDYRSLLQIGSMMGSGGMIVMSEKDCMVNIAKFYLEFTVEESCGKCTPCRVGNKRLLEILTKITQGKGSPDDLYELRELSEVIKDTSLCGLGQTAPNPVLSTLRFFMDEYEAHVNEGRCPAGVCQDLLRYEIIAEKCVGCTACARICPVSCISGKVKQPHVINQSACIKCGACMNKCKFKAISKN